MRSLPCSRCSLARLAFLLTALASVSTQAQAPRPNDDHELVALSAASSLTLAQVRSRFGEPSQRVGADLWVYWNFPTSNRTALRAGYDTLIVHVVGERARAIKLVRSTEVRALLHQLGQSNRHAASTQHP